MPRTLAVALSVRSTCAQRTLGRARKFARRGDSDDPGGAVMTACCAAPTAVTLRRVGASVTLTAPAVAVEPGSEATLEFRLRNTGSVVDEFTLGILGDAAGWTAVIPPTISLFPGAEETGRIVFRPPRSSTVPAGAMPVRAPRRLARRRRRIDGRGGDRPGRPVPRPVRGARAAHVARQPIREPRPRGRQPRQRPPQRRGRGRRRRPEPPVRREAAGRRRRARHGVVRQGPGQAGQALLARLAQDPPVPARRPLRGRAAGDARRRASPGGDAPAVVRAGGHGPDRAAHRPDHHLAVRPQAVDRDRGVRGRRVAARRAPERRQQGARGRRPPDDGSGRGVAPRRSHPRAPGRAVARTVPVARRRRRRPPAARSSRVSAIPSTAGSSWGRGRWSPPERCS